MDPVDAESRAQNREDVGPLSALIPIFARTHRNRAAALLGELGLSPGQELVLMLLWQEEPLAQTAITHALAVEPPTIAKTLARMERSGTIARQRSQNDRRVMLVSLTEKGRELQEPVESVWRTLEAETNRGLTAAETEQLIGLVRKSLAGLRAPRQRPTDPTEPEH